MPVTIGSDGNPQLIVGEDQPQCLAFAARDIRRNATGMHANIGVFSVEGEVWDLMASNVFNVGRSAEQGKLCRDAHRRLPLIPKNLYPVEAIELEMVTFCLWIDTQWEQQRFEDVQYEPDDTIPPMGYALEPYIQDRGGTIVFAPRQSGKSYLAMVWAASIANGLDAFWLSEKRPVVYVNLERDPDSMHRRDEMLRQALGIPRSNIRWLHARGHGMESVARQVKRMVDDDTVVIYDSISRMGLGALNEDATANRAMDLANWVSRCWVAIGHTARSDESHVFGSTHFENAADVIVRVNTEHKPTGTIGMMLTMTKANDQPPRRPESLAFDFGPSGLTAVRKALDREFTKLLATSADSAKPRLQSLIDYIQMAGPCSATEAADGTGLPRTNISTWFNSSGLFKVNERRGKEIIYGLKESTDG